MKRSKFKRGSITIETLVFLPSLIIILMLLASIMKFDTDIAIIDSQAISSLRDISDIDTRIHLLGINDAYENIIERDDIKKVIEDVEMYGNFISNDYFKGFLSWFEKLESEIDNNYVYGKILSGIYKKDLSSKLENHKNLYSIPDLDRMSPDLSLSNDSIVISFKYDYFILGDMIDYSIPISVEKKIGRYDISGLDIVGIISNLGNKTVYVTDQGSRYHVEDCQYLKKSKNAVKLKDLNKEKYKPCKLCIEKKVYGGLKYNGKH